MEACEANFLDEDWESLSKLFSIEECISYSDETDESSLNFLNQQNLSYDHGLTFNHQDNNTSEPSMIFHMADNLNMSIFSDDHHHLMENVLSLKSETWCNNNEQLRLRENDDSINELELKRNYVETSCPRAQDDIDSSEGPQKKARSHRNYKSKRAAQPRKSKKVMEERDTNEEETINNAKGKQSSSCCSINIFDHEDSIHNDNNSQEISKSSVSLNSNGKAKAMRGSATDSQSLYARRRRERINERLKILQTLVPNGTKVDISTMLEEAVHYVKFLQLQIKLLSSDELWMYASIAYNGLMDIEMYQKICPDQRP